MPPLNNYEKYLHDIGKKIAAARHLRGEKEDTIAKAVGLTQATISKIECGRYNSLNVSTIVRLGEYLKIPMNELLPLNNDENITSNVTVHFQLYT